MKRNFISIMLFSALLLGGGSAFTSCSDCNTCKDVQVRVGSLSEDLTKQVQALQAQIDKMNGILNGTDGNAANGLVNQVQQLKNDLATKEAELKQLIDEKNNATKTEIINKLNTEINNINIDITQIKSDIQTAQADITNLKNRMDDAEQDIRDAKQAATDAETNAKNYTDQQIAAEVARANNALQEAINDLKAQLEVQMTNCQNGCKAYTDEKFDAMKEITDGLDDQLAEYAQYIQQLYLAQSELETKILTDSALLAQVKDKQEELNIAVTNMKEKLDAKVDTADFNSLKAAVTENLKKIKENKADIDSIKNALVDKVSQQDLDDKAEELQKAFKKADEELKDEIDAALEKIQTQLNKLFNAMVNMITGIELQATESPVTGYENLSFLGAEAHFLGAYYGTASAGDVTLNGEPVVTRNGEILLDTESGENAGVVYATINPSNYDFTGTTLKVVDSQGNEAPFTATVEKSDRVLTYGVTRAGGGSKSNLYAIKINIDKSKLDDAKTWTSDDATKLKSAAKAVLEKLRRPSTTRLNLKEVASEIMDVFNNRLTAYALEAEQEVTDGKNKETRLITSKMSLAATAFKPLSYNFLKDNQKVENFDLPRIPTLQSKINFSEYKFNWTPIAAMPDIKTSVTLEGMPDINSITINGSVPVPDVTVNTWIIGQDKVTGEYIPGTGELKLNLDSLKIGAKVTIGDIDVSKLQVTYSTKTQDFQVTVPMDDFNKIIEGINSQVGNMIQSVNGIVDKVQGYVSDIDGKYITRINEYIQKFENLLRKSNSLLQPALFYTTNTGSWGQLAREEIGATYLKLSGGKASTIFVASSYNGEILCPAYKRCIYVSKKPDGATVSGTNLGKVVDGETRKIGFEANKAGTYELTYEAVDYSGVKVSKKFYVKVVE